VRDEVTVDVKSTITLSPFRYSDAALCASEASKHTLKEST